MDDLKAATAQFEHQSGDKEYNMSVIDKLSGQAARAGAQVIAFHECSITGYTFARHLSKMEMLDLSEFLPEGASVKRLTEIARKNKIAILAGLFEKDENDQIYKAYICVGEKGMIAKYLKIHPFINPHILPGDAYCVFNLFGWKCGILIC
jgi:predicted amidohydrolase